MPKRRRNNPNELISDGAEGQEFDDLERVERFSRRSKHHQRNKMARTLQWREQTKPQTVDVDALPVGRVVQVFSLYTALEHEGTTYLGVGRRTYERATGLTPIVGDFVRFRPTGTTEESGLPQAVIERILPRRTVLTRAESFKQRQSHPIVANADKMLIVAAVRQPTIKWGLIDRMVIAARAGGLVPIVCINKIDLGDQELLKEVGQILSHYQTLGLQTIQCSATGGQGLEQVRQVLESGTTVLAGHSGVGKSSLVRAMDPSVDIRIGAISGYTGKGTHTTTSARLYHLSCGGDVIDTPGVKLFGLWGLTRRKLEEFFPDVVSGTAPAWRVQSYQRMAESVGEEP